MNTELLKQRPKENHGFIYCYTSPSNKKYVGKTIESLKIRAGKDGKGYRNCTALMRAFEKYGYENFTVEILEEVPYEDLNDKEKYYIQLYKTQNPQYGYNIKPGGAVEYIANTCSLKREVSRYNLEGVFIESFASIKECARKMGIPYQAVSQNCRGEITHYKDSIYKYKEDNCVIPVSVKKTHGRKTGQYDLEGNLIATFSSANEAARALGKPTAAGRNIRAVCEGKRITTFGYKWKFLD